MNVYCNCCSTSTYIVRSTNKPTVCGFACNFCRQRNELAQCLWKRWRRRRLDKYFNSTQISNGKIKWEVLLLLLSSDIVDVQKRANNKLTELNKQSRKGDAQTQILIQAVSICWKWIYRQVNIHNLNIVWWWIRSSHLLRIGPSHHVQCETFALEHVLRININSIWLLMSLRLHKHYGINTIIVAD